MDDYRAQEKPREEVKAALIEAMQKNPDAVAERIMDATAELFRLSATNQGAVEALREIRTEADATPWYDAGEGLAEIVRLVDAALSDQPGGRSDDSAASREIQQEEER